MTKLTKWVLISSIILNLVQMAGFLMFRNAMEKSILKIGTLNAVSNATETRHILRELETNDPNKIEALKIYLRNIIEMSNKEADEYRNAKIK